MKKMLIIEDDQIVGNIYRHKFQVEGYQVEVAADGEAGVTAVNRFHPDVVILDLMLPKLNGVEVLKRLRSKPETKSLPVIVLSNAYLSSLVQEAWKAGANHCMIKANCTPKQLVDVVNKTLGSLPGNISPAPTQAATASKASSARTPGAAEAAQPRTVVTEDDTAFQTELSGTAPMQSRRRLYFRAAAVY